MYVCEEKASQSELNTGNDGGGSERWGLGKVAENIVLDAAARCARQRWKEREIDGEKQ